MTETLECPGCGGIIVVPEEALADGVEDLTAEEWRGEHG